MKLSPAQKKHLQRLYKKGRLQVGRKSGIPESTAKVLERLGLARIEWLPICPKRSGKFHDFYAVPVYLTTT